MTDNGSQAETAQAEARQRAEYQKAFLGKRQQKQNMANQAKAPLQQAQGADKARQARMKNKNYPNSPGQIKKGLNTSNRQVRGKNSSIENKAKNVLAGGSLQAKNKSKSSRVSPSSKKTKKGMQELYTNGFRLMASLVLFLPMLLALNYFYIKGGMEGGELYKFKLWQEFVLFLIDIAVVAIFLIILFLLLYIIEFVAHPWNLLEDILGF